MSFKDDFNDALRNVKRGFSAGPEATGSARPDSSEQTIPGQAAPHEYLKDTAQPAQTKSTATDGDDGEIGSDVEGDTTPFASFGADDFLAIGGESPAHENKDRARIEFAEGDNRVYDDSKTVISKNTVIRGSIQTDDPVRLLGQIMGDVDCKANIVVAGKVRGNTTAANAYIYDAKVDGDIRCDDVITVSSDAWILGNIKAHQAEIDGKIKGNMEIRQMVSIGSQSSILGDITTDELEIKRGAFINGAVRCMNEDRQPLKDAE